MDYQMKDVCKIADIKMSQAQYWTRLSIVEADITGPTTQGKARLFSLKNLFEFSLVRELTKRGVEAIATKGVLEKVRESFLSSADLKIKLESIAWRLITDPLLVYFGKSFFLGNLVDIGAKGVPYIWFGEEPPPPEFMKVFNAVGFGEKISLLAQHYASLVIVNLETLRDDLMKRLQEMG
jgi:hypothetical protein